MKSLHIPAVNTLDDCKSLEQIAEILTTQGAEGLIDTANWPDRNMDEPVTHFYAAHSDSHIYILYDVTGCGLLAQNTANQSPVSRDSCVEFFVDPLCNGHYWNLEFNCIGAVNASHRSRRDNKTPLTDAEISTIRRYTSCGHKPIDPEVPETCHWQFAVAIPFELLGVKYEGKPLAMLANFNKCASASQFTHFMTWNPITIETPDFHRPDHFGKIIIE